MDTVITNSDIETRKRTGRKRKAWKYIRDVNTAVLSDLNRIAIEDGTRKYTYGLMFREWERYASVFSALDMTGEKKSRVGILGSTCIEVIFSLYGLNMTGADVSIIPAYSTFTPGKIMDSIKNEKLTDLIITDDFAQPNIISEMIVRRGELGLNNIIVLHVPLTGITVDPLMNTMQEFKYNQMKIWLGAICMDELLKHYGNHPVSYAPEDSGDAAFILHTSGTTGGAGKPVALSDRAFNEAAACFYDMEGLDLPWDNLVTAVIVDLSNAYGIIDQVHLPFAMGAKVVVAPGGILNPFFYRAISKYKITFLFTISAMFERWMKMPGKMQLDFSSLSFVALGGTAISAADKKRYMDFMQKHGAGDITLLNGYGISELGGACCLSTPNIDDESIGYALPGVNVRLMDDESGKLYGPKDAPCEGVLYLNSPAMATTKLDDTEILKIEKIGGKAYVCTNDLVQMSADGKLTFLGRANRYFINEEGRKYESGRVETEFARQPGIESCCVVPVYIKTTHDNIPMLCVKALGEDDPKETVTKALMNVFAIEKTLDAGNIPSRVLIAEELPRNGNGKIDLYKIGRGEAHGDIYTIKPVKSGDDIKDFELMAYEEGPADMIKEVFDGISAEIKNNLPLNNSKSYNSKGDDKMNNAKKAFETWTSMNKMGMQWMNNMMSKMMQMSKAQNFSNAFNSGVPDMQKMMKEMQDRMTGVQDKMNDLQGEAQDKAKEAAANVMPMIQKQMQQAFEAANKMNQMAFDMNQKIIDQNLKMMEQMMAAMESMAPKAAPAEKKTPAKAAKASASKTAKAAPKAKKPAKTAAGKDSKAKK